MPPKKETAAKKTPSTAKKTVTQKVAKAKIEKQVAENARHIEENTREIKNDTKLIHILYGVIIVLLIILACLAFFVGQNMGKGSGSGNIPSVNTTWEWVEILVIDDSRCDTCETDTIVQQISSLPFLGQATITQKDFVDDNMSEYMQTNDLKSIPVVVFNTNVLYDGGQIVPYLQPLSSGDGYSLILPETFDPFATRSENGYLVLDETQTYGFQNANLTDGNPEAPITWIEYSDMECPYCAKLHNDGTPDIIAEKYGDNINFVFQHFPLDFHPDAQKAAEALECMNEQNPDVVFDVIHESYSQYGENNFDYDGFLNIAADRGIDTTAVQSCVDAGTYSQQVLDEMKEGQDIFGITGTPGNVILNNQTGEYVVISWAYPPETFETEINKMLGEDATEETTGTGETTE